MALSNKFGSMVLSTATIGNRRRLLARCMATWPAGSPSSPTCPSFMVYELAEYINRERELIPRSTIEKPPSAELRPNQKDSDSLPPYEVLDRILKAILKK